jgi:hypothetical protein
MSAKALLLLSIFRLRFWVLSLEIEQADPGRPGKNHFTTEPVSR